SPSPAGTPASWPSPGARCGTTRAHGPSRV
ncbi:MAG: hypothetical protein AVDCRST_MAG11-3310, partial [uncultured Gemmatimonadaceae bacterium]